MAGIGFDWSRDWSGEDVSILLTERQQQLLLFLMQSVNLNPSYYISDYSDSEVEDINDFTSLVLAALMGDPVPSLFGFHRYDFNVLKPDNQSGSFSMNTGFATQLNLCCLQSTAQNNYFEYKQYLKKGGYSIDMNVVKHNSAGIITLTVNGNSAGTFDCYNASNLLNQFIGPSGVSIPSDGVYAIRLAMNTKNALSAGYGLIISQLAIRKTS